MPKKCQDTNGSPFPPLFTFCPLPRQIRSGDVKNWTRRAERSKNVEIFGEEKKRKRGIERKAGDPKGPSPVVPAIDWPGQFFCISQEESSSSLTSCPSISASLSDVSLFFSHSWNLLREKSKERKGLIDDAIITYNGRHLTMRTAL